MLSHPHRWPLWSSTGHILFLLYTTHTHAVISSRWRAPLGQPAVTPRHIGVSGEPMNLNGFFSSAALHCEWVTQCIGEWGQKESLGIIILIHAQLWFRLSRIPYLGLEWNAEMQWQKAEKYKRSLCIYVVMEVVVMCDFFCSSVACSYCSQLNE